MGHVYRRKYPFDSDGIGFRVSTVRLYHKEGALMKQKIIIFLFIVFYLVSVVSIAFCEENKKAPSSESVKTVNNIVIDTGKKEIRLRTKLAIMEGILDFFLVDEIGQTYESVFKITDNKPSDLHFALLLLGFKPVPFDEFYNLLKEKNGLDVLKKKNSLLEILISQNNKEVSLSSIIRNRESDKDQKLAWVFTGGAFDERNQYIPDSMSIYISIQPELATVINLFSTAGNPYRGELGYEINKDLPFTMEDEFTLIIRGAR
jgi:hypothetical protein